MVLTASGEEYVPPAPEYPTLTEAEGHVIVKALGLNRRNHRPDRNRFVAGSVATRKLVASMAEKGLVRLLIDHSRNVLQHKVLNPKRKGEVVAMVTEFGYATFKNAIGR